MAKVSKIRWEVAQFLEFRWWVNYLRGKDTETYQEQKIAYWKMLLAGNGATPVATIPSQD